jgi:hypothetical protein
VQWLTTIDADGGEVVVVAAAAATSTAKDDIEVISSLRNQASRR